MARPTLRTLSLSSRLGLAALLVVGLTGWGVSLLLTARTGPPGLTDAFGPEGTRLRVCAPPLERAIETTMRRHIPRARERRVLVTWMRAGGTVTRWYGAPSRVVARRCASCHGRAPQAGIRLETWADAYALTSPEGRDPYHRLRHLHVHLFAIGAVLSLLLLALGRTRFPTGIVRLVGGAPVVALLLSVPLSLWACGTSWAPTLIWLCEGAVALGWPVASGLLLWDLFAPLQDAAPGEGSES